jgi:hypothetical protein
MPCSWHEAMQLGLCEDFATARLGDRSLSSSSVQLEGGVDCEGECRWERSVLKVGRISVCLRCSSYMNVTHHDTEHHGYDQVSVLVDSTQACVDWRRVIFVVVG